MLGIPPNCTFFRIFRARIWIYDYTTTGKGALSTPIQTSLRSLFENPPSFVVMANVAILRCIVLFNEKNTPLLAQFALFYCQKHLNFLWFFMIFISAFGKNHKPHQRNFHLEQTMARIMYYK